METISRSEIIVMAVMMASMLIMSIIENKDINKKKKQQKTLDFLCSMIYNIYRKRGNNHDV